VAKQGARGGAAPASRPGAVSASSSSSLGTQHLSQLEQDIVAKQGARGGAAPATRPGASSVKNNTDGNLSQLERDIAAKTQAASRSTSSTTTPASVANKHLSQLEQDIAAKQGARGVGTAPISRPGAVAEGGAGQQLTRLEQAIASKTLSSTTTTTTANANLTQLERDVVTKTQARGGGVAPATVPGVASSLSSQDQDSKMAARAAPASQPGAMSAGGAGELTQLEQDIVNKQGAASVTVQSVAAPAAASASLTQLEQDLMAKANAGGSSVVPSPQTHTDPHLSQLEQDVMAKQGPAAMQPPSPPVVSTISAANELAFLEQDTMRKIQSQNTSDSFAHEPIHHGDIATQPPLPSSFDIPTQAQFSPTYAPGVNPSNAYQEDIEMPIYPDLSGLDIAGAEQGGIQAFVADNVVDATGVAVLKSDEEEEKEVKRRQMKILICLGIVVSIILIAVIVPTALLAGPEDVPVVITEAPSMAPSMMPSSAPTSIEIPRTVEALTQYSTEESLRNANSPQGKAIAWLVNEDPYVIQEGLTFRNPKYIQRYVLAVFYFSLGGDDWEICNRADTDCSDDKKSWLSAYDECSWYLLDCNQEYYINTVDFCKLFRVVLDSCVSFNYCFLPLPMFPITVNDVISIHTYKNIRLTGAMPSEFQYLTSVEKLLIPDMQLTGPIFDYVAGMSDLEIFSIPDNRFNGTFPSSFVADHPRLNKVDLSRNNFTGPLPLDFDQLPLLTKLSLSENEFSGPIPPNIGKGNIGKQTFYRSLCI